MGSHIDRKSTRLNSSHDQISYAVFCLKKKKTFKKPDYKRMKLVGHSGLEKAPKRQRHHELTSLFRRAGQPGHQTQCTTMPNAEPDNMHTQSLCHISAYSLI